MSPSSEPVKLSQIVDKRVEQVRQQFIESGYDPSTISADTNRHFLLGGLEDVARELGVPLIVEFDEANPDSIPPPATILRQLEGRPLRIGMKVEFQLQEWILIGGDPVDATHGEICDGDIIPEGCSFEQLCFAPKKFINVDV